MRKNHLKKGHQNVKFTENSPINYVIQLLGLFEICICYIITVFLTYHPSNLADKRKLVRFFKLNVRIVSGSVGHPHFKKDVQIKGYGF